MQFVCRTYALQRPTLVISTCEIWIKVINSTKDSPESKSALRQILSARAARLWTHIRLVTPCNTTMRKFSWYDLTHPGGRLGLKRYIAEIFRLIFGNSALSHRCSQESFCLCSVLDRVACQRTLFKMGIHWCSKMFQLWRSLTISNFNLRLSTVAVNVVSLESMATPPWHQRCWSNSVPRPFAPPLESHGISSKLNVFRYVQSYHMIYGEIWTNTFIIYIIIYIIIIFSYICIYI